MYYSPKISTASNVYNQLYNVENAYTGYAQLYQRLFGYAKVYYSNGKIVDAPDLTAADISYYYQSKYGALQLEFEGKRVKKINSAHYFSILDDKTMDKPTCENIHSSNDNIEFTNSFIFKDCVPSFFEVKTCENKPENLQPL